MNFFLDANMPYSTFEVFEEFDLEAVHAKDVELSEATDREIMDYAIKTKSILVTKDLEFANITIFPPESHFGVVVLRLPSNFKAHQFVNVFREFLKSISIKDLEKSITIVKLGRYRIRKFV